MRIQKKKMLAVGGRRQFGTHPVRELFQHIPQTLTALFVLALLMVLGGIFVFSIDRVGHGRRGIMEATVLDAFLVGLFHSVGMIPGFSPVGLGIVGWEWNLLSA